MKTDQISQAERAPLSSLTDTRLAVIGLGYVGLPLATAAAQAGTAVTGIDLDGGKVDAGNVT